MQTNPWSFILYRYSYTSRRSSKRWRPCFNAARLETSVCDVRQQTKSFCVTNKPIFFMTCLINCEWVLLMDFILTSSSTLFYSRAYNQQMKEKVEKILLWPASTRRGHSLATVSVQSMWSEAWRAASTFYNSKLHFGASLIQNFLSWRPQTLFNI